MAGGISLAQGISIHEIVPSRLPLWLLRLNYKG
jgi:hypothetical protein